MLMLLAVTMTVSCTQKKEQDTKAPTRVKTVTMSSASADDAQTYVGIVEEREATAVSFTGMGVVK